MAKLFLFLTIIASGAALFFGYMTKDKISGIAANVAAAKQQATDATTKLNKANDDLKTAKQQVAAANDATAAAKASVASIQAVADTAIKAQADLQTQLTDMTKQRDDAIAKSGTGGPTQPPVDQAVLDALKKQVADANAKAAEAQQLLATQTDKIKASDDEIQSLRKEKARHEGRVMAKGLEGEVMAVNQGWNFVVVSIGDRQGAVANAQLVVKRGDTMIGKLKISSVEPSTSIADIIPDSVPKGERVLPGDRVIYPGQ